jgi:excisionase family DNA binding protein
MPRVNPRQPIPWMTLEQAAERTGRSLRLLQRWAREGRIPAAKVGRIWLVAEADIAAIEAMPRTPGRKAGKA